MRIKETARDYLSFGKRDRMGVIAVVLLIAIIYALPYLFARRKAPFPVQENPALSSAIDSLAVGKKSNPFQQDEHENNDQYFFEPRPSKGLQGGELFRFDPNTLPVEGWQRLGLSARTSRTIEKYRRKGGKFRHPEDLRKIWGMPEGFYQRVKDYIVIAFAPADEQNKVEQKGFSRPGKKPIIIDINEADTSAFIALPGIGSKLANRIVNFRERLGGFYSVDQIGETYGLQDSVFQKIRGSLQLGGPVKKLNVNTATKEELKAHPYIKWNLANAIVEYRNQHGPFKTLDELKNIVLVDEAAYKKMTPYLSLQ